MIQNILIFQIKRCLPQVAERINFSAEEDSLAMSFITWAELLPGAEGSQHPEATLQQFEVLARQVTVLYPEGAAICPHYAEQATALRRHAHALSATLVSHNVCEVSRIEGLRLVDLAASA